MSSSFNIAVWCLFDQVHAEYDTLHEAGLHTFCFHCGKALQELTYSGLKAKPFSYSPIAELQLEGINKSKEKFVCSSFCAESAGEQWKRPIGCSLRNSSNHLHLADAESDAIEVELKHYGDLLRLNDSTAGGSSTAAASARASVITARPWILAGAVLCAVTGEIEDIKMEGQNTEEDTEMKEEEHKEGGDASAATAAAAATQHVNCLSAPQLLLTELGLKKKLVFDSKSVASYLRFAQEGEAANASIVAQYSLTLADDSPLRKKKVLAPGAIVIVAETAINPGDAVIVAFPPKNQKGEYYVPRPMDLLTTPIVTHSSSHFAKRSIVQATDGFFRLPGDVPPDYGGEDSEDESEPDVLTEPPVPGAHHVKVNALLQSRLSAKSKSRCAELFAEDDFPYREGIFPLSVFRSTILLPTDYTAVSLELSRSTSADHKRGAHAQPLLLAGGSGEDPEREFEGRKRNATFDLWSATFDQRSLVEEDWLSTNEPIVVNLEYCKQFDCVLTDEQSREELPAAAKIVAEFPFSAFFENDIISGAFPASMECKESWISAIRCILTGPVLKTELSRMKDARDAEGSKDFFPSIIVESIAALFKELLDDRKGLPPTLYIADFAAIISMLMCAVSLFSMQALCTRTSVCPRRIH
jgi:hypothetical protein